MEYQPLFVQQHKVVFIILFFITALLLMYIRYFYKSRFMLNVSKPNVYIFEYESLSSLFFSQYHFLSFFLRFLTSAMLIISIIEYIPQIRNLSFLNYLKLSSNIILSLMLFFFIKRFLSIIFYVWKRKQKKWFMLNTIRNVYWSFMSFYFFVISFLVYFFPFKSTLFFILIAVALTFYIVINWIQMFLNISKHTDLKSNQIFLYLCTTEILPLTVLVWWISFQIL